MAAMKKDYGLVNREEGPLVGAPTLPRREDRKASKRYVAIGSSVMLLAAGAVLGYAALPSRVAPVMDVSNLEASAPDRAQIASAVDSMNAQMDDMPTFIIDEPNYSDSQYGGIVAAPEFLSPRRPPISIDEAIEIPMDDSQTINIDDYGGVNTLDGGIIDAPELLAPRPRYVTGLMPDQNPTGLKYVPPVAELDLDNDGRVTVEEFLHRSIRRHCEIVDRVKMSLLSDIAKDYIADRLRRHYAREAWCASQIATRDIDKGGVMMNDFTLFYSAIQTTCDLYDSEIPPEFQPDDKRAPTSAPIDSVAPTPAPSKAPIHSIDRTDIPEGHAIKCDWESNEVFRFTNGVRRFYPDPVVAASWDPFWHMPLIVNCPSVPRGDDMPMNVNVTLPPRTKMSSAILSDGQSFRCDWGSPEVFRLVNGFRCWYPTPEIAASWDPHWDDCVVVDCRDVARGEDMKPFGTLPPPMPPRVKVPPALLIEGQSIKCDLSELEVYRFTNNERRWYPNPEIAASWDPMWFAITEADCTTLKRGIDMPFKTTKDPWTRPPKLTPGELKIGQAIKCEWDEPEVYQYTGAERRWYPTPDIAAYYDPFWNLAVVADCTLIPRYIDMPDLSTATPTNPPIPPLALKEGSSIKCDDNPDFVYRYIQGVLRFYPTGLIASSWDPYWYMAPITDCSTLKRGDNMEFNGESTMQPTLPPRTLKEGDSIRCNGNADFVYRYTNGMIRFFRTAEVASSWDEFWYAAPFADCSDLKRGDEMEYNTQQTSRPTQAPRTLIEGESIKCDGNADFVYRYTQGTIRFYPSGAIAASWDPYWYNSVSTDCSMIPHGKDMEYNGAPPTEPPHAPKEGDTVKCDFNPDRVYRYTQGILRFYPTEQIAASWDPYWYEAQDTDCSVLKRGDDMDYNGTPPPAPKVPKTQLYEGQAIMCPDDNTKVYRFTDNFRRLYPTDEIATSWDPYWTGAVVADCDDITHGKDMRMKTLTVFNGQTVQCLDGSTLYRYWNGTIYEYPNTGIADSWDATWSMTAVTIDCAPLPKGPAMQKKLPLPINLCEGQTIQCGTEKAEVYRYTSGMRRWYPSVSVRLSWDPLWDGSALFDCSDLPKGPNMEFHQPLLTNGLAVRCVGSPDVFQYMNESIRLYPTEEIAYSWDATWKNAVRVNCTRLARGIDMQLKPVPPTSLKEGQTVRCAHDEVGVYRFSSGEVRLYGTLEVALSWDVVWTEAVLVDCSALTTGPPMDFKRPPLIDGQTVRCSSNSTDLFRYANKMIRAYDDWRYAESFDPDFRNAIEVYCPAFARGPNMRFNLGKLQEGQSVKCDNTDGAVYRFTSAQRRLYPTYAIALSWDLRALDTYVVVDCPLLPQGDDMKFKLPIVPEGQYVSCTESTAMYIYMNGELHAIPDADVPRSWTPGFMPLVLPCNNFPKGLPMKPKLPSPYGLPDGTPIKCGDEEGVFRYTSAMRRLYPSETIAQSWDPNWKNFQVVDCSSLPRGPNMVSNWPLKEGETVRCYNEAVFYRYVNGTIRPYPTTEVAQSWDPNALMTSTMIDCSRYPKGPIMSARSVLYIPEGQAIKCSAADSETYRFTCGSRRLYPTEAIADSWDPSWRKPMIVDCRWILITTPNMPMYKAPPVPMTEGETVTCPADPNNYYRFCSNELRQYMDDWTAKSWDREYVNHARALADCTNLRKTTLLPIRRPYLPDGQVVTCDDTNNLYRYDGNIYLRRYPTHEIAESWDSNWENPIRIDCEFLKLLDDMGPRYPRFNLTEGAAAKCAPERTDIYRYTSGSLRLYPTPPIAVSWDPFFFNATVVNCSQYTRGPDMDWKMPVLYDGLSVKCGDAPGIYRYMNGTLRLYPSREVAMSWDPNYENSSRINCSLLIKGKDLALKLPPPTGLPEGQAIKCDTTSAVYRLTSGQRRWYPSQYIAASWDLKYLSAPLIDCSGVPEGPWMRFNQPFIYQYQSIKCDDGYGTYRYNNGTIRLYPSPEIAYSWDVNYPSAVKADCSNFTIGPWHSLRLRSPAGLPDGQAIKCDTTSAVYRLTGGQMRFYPSPLIASSWDPNWRQALMVECSDLTRGNAMQYNYPLLTNGQSIKCDEGYNVYRYFNQTIYWFPSQEIATSWDANWRSAIVVDCGGLAKGPQLDFKLPSPYGFPDGTAIKCSPTSGLIYRLTSAQRRWYPSDVIAQSWDTNYKAAVAVDCSSLPEGINMPFKQPPLVDGQPVVCGVGPMIYRYVNGTIFWYPSPPIAASWDPMYMYPTIIDCSMLPRGPDLKLRSVNGWKQLDGSMTQLSFDGKQLCGVTSRGNGYCARTNFRGEGVTTWRSLPGSLIQVVVYGDVMYGLGQDLTLRVGSALSDNPSWVMLGGPFKHITTDNKQLCVVTPNGEVMCANSDLRIAPNWRKVEGSFGQVEIANGRLFGVRPALGLFTGRASGPSKWEYQRSPLDQISFDGVRLCGTSRGDVLCATSGLSSTPQWSKPLGKMASVVVNAGDMFGVNEIGEVFYRAVD